MRKIHFILFALLATSCGGVSTKERKIAEDQQEAKWQETISKLDYGPPPPQNYKEGFMNAVSKKLLDPESGIFKEITAPKAGWLDTRNQFEMMTGAKSLVRGWIMCGQVKGKNTFGGYADYKNVVVVYYKGDYIDIDLNPTMSVLNEDRFISYCGYLPFNR